MGVEGGICTAERVGEQLSVSVHIVCSLERERERENVLYIFLVCFNRGDLK